MDNTETLFDKDWFSVYSYEFKILVMIAVLAQKQLAYRGKLKDMCDFLGVKNTSTNTEKIKNAITALEEAGDIKTIKDGYTWTLTLSVKAEKKREIIKIKKAWVKLIKNYKAENKNDAVDWENVLKVLVYLIADVNTDVKTYEDIAKALNISVSTVKRSITALDTIKFEDIVIARKLAWILNKQGEFKVIGQRIDVGHNFN